MPVSNANDVRRIIKDRMIHFFRLGLGFIVFPDIVGSAIPQSKAIFGQIYV
jgi:hypothetical protein